MAVTAYVEIGERVQVVAHVVIPGGKVCLWSLLTTPPVHLPMSFGIWRPHTFAPDCDEHCLVDGEGAGCFTRSSQIKQHSTWICLHVKKWSWKFDLPFPPKNVKLGPKLDQGKVWTGKKYGKYTKIPQIVKLRFHPYFSQFPPSCGCRVAVVHQQEWCCRFS